MIYSFQIVWNYSEVITDFDGDIVYFAFVVLLKLSTAVSFSSLLRAGSEYGRLPLRCLNRR